LSSGSLNASRTKLRDADTVLGLYPFGFSSQNTTCGRSVAISALPNNSSFLPIIENA